MSWVTLAVEFDFGSGPMDLLAVDAAGRLVSVEFKRGSENPDVRKVIAQVLDYGNSLWRTGYEDFERAWEPVTRRTTQSTAETRSMSGAVLGQS